MKRTLITLACTLSLALLIGAPAAAQSKSCRSVRLSVRWTHSLAHKEPCAGNITPSVFVGRHQLEQVEFPPVAKISPDWVTTNRITYLGNGCVVQLTQHHGHVIVRATTVRPIAKILVRLKGA